LPDTITKMARALCIGLIFLFAAAAFATDQPAAPATGCADGIPGATACTVSKQTRKEAKTSFERGMKFQREKRLDEAFTEFDHASKLIPNDVQYLTLKELVRQQLVFNHVQSGNAALTAGKQVEALGEFRTAVSLDPDNQFAAQRLQDALGEWAPSPKQAAQIVEDHRELHVAPNPQLQSFHFRGDSKALLTQVAAAYGLTPIFDDTVVSRRVHFDVENVDFETAMPLANRVTNTFYSALDDKHVLIAAESTTNHAQYDRMGMRAFYLPDFSSAGSDFQDIVNTLRTLFDLRFVGTQPQSGTIIVRGPQPIVEAATQFLQNIDGARPEVILDIRVYQISNSLIRDFGLHLPNQFNLYNIPIGALAALGGQNIQQLINQLIAGGGINQANSSAISSLIAQLSGGQNSIFSQPLATFGGGLTFMGLSLDQLSLTLQQNESAVRSLEHLTVRATQGKDSNFLMGSRYPVINASFAPIYNTPAISQVLQNNTYISPVPSVSYEDLGVKVKAKPVVHANSDISMEIEISIRALAGQSSNGVPVISNREYKGSINLKNGEPAVIASSIDDTEMRTLSGIPGLAQVPGLNKIAATNSVENDEDELLVVMTPHISRESQALGREVWLSRNP
jgi:general secretion pathway protein D